jgi:hypothetical protein
VLGRVRRYLLQRGLRSEIQKGEACTETRSCEPGLVCHATCIAGDVDTPCAGDRDCDADAWCDRAAGLCRADPTPGA